MNAKLHGASGKVVLAALEQNLWSLWSRFGLGDGCRLHEQDDALWFDTPIEMIPYNGVLRFAAEQDTDRRITAIFDHYKRRDVPFFWLVHPTAQPADIVERLRAHGMEEVEVCPGMFMDLCDLPERGNSPEGAEIREVCDEADVRDALELVAWRWGVPVEAIPRLVGVTQAFEMGKPDRPIRCWLARRNGAPVAKVILNLAVGAAGLYGVVTKPEARGLGLARHLALRALYTARQEGYTLGVLHSTPMAQSLYEKIGFRPVAPFRVFAPPRAFHL